MLVSDPASEIAQERMLMQAVAEVERRRARQRTITTLFPDEGPYRRELYPKHLEFFRAGSWARQRLFIAGNRVGKTRAGCYEDVLHLTGLYDSIAPWWEGRRFVRPVKAWVCGTTDEKIKETLQEELFGPVGSWGSGLVPGGVIQKIDRAVGPVKDLIDTAYIRHVSGGVSTLQFKSYRQGREGYEGTHRDVIHCDEEVPMDIKGECLLRTMDTDGWGPGLLLFTFTPLQGLSEVVLDFMPEGMVPEGEQRGEKYVVQAGWEDVPHLSEDERATLLASIPPFQRDARSRGMPVLGAGVIYPVPEDVYVVEPLEIPKHWCRAYGMDVGWNWTAAVWSAYDRESDTEYVYHEYKRSEAEPSIHTSAIKAPGAWIRGVIDPASNGRAQHDGERLLQQYRQLGLTLAPAKNAVDAGIYEVWERLATGRLKVFSTCRQLLSEMRLYRRDEKGRVVKVNDHLCDALRYRVLSGRGVATAQPVVQEQAVAPALYRPRLRPGSWMRL